MKKIKKYLKELFCRHKFKHINSVRYNVINMNGEKDGEVTLHLFLCNKCGRDKIMATDRTYVKEH